MKLILYIILLLFFNYHAYCSITLSPTHATSKNTTHQAPAKKRRAYKRAIAKTKKEAKNRFKLDCIGVGLGGDFEKLSLEFYYYEPLTEDEGRFMVIECAKIFSKHLEKNYKENQKLPSAITIYSLTKEFKHYASPLISVASISSGGLHFDKKSKEQEFGYSETSNESFQEAEAKNEAYLLRQESNQDSNL